MNPHEPETPDERIQIVYCIGCERVTLPGDCESDDHGRLNCPRCGTVVVPESIHDYIFSGGQQ